MGEAKGPQTEANIFCKLTFFIFEYPHHLCRDKAKSIKIVKDVKLACTVSPSTRQCFCILFIIYYLAKTRSSFIRKRIAAVWLNMSLGCLSWISVYHGLV